MKTILRLLAAAAVPLGVYLSAYVVPAGEYAVITSFGRPSAIRREPGLYFKLPDPFAVINRMDARFQLFSTSLVEYLTADKKNLIVQAFACWRVSDPLMFFQAIHDLRNAEEKLDDLLSSLVGAAIGLHTMDQVISTEPHKVKISSVAAQIADEANRRAAGYGIEVEHVGFSRLALPEDNARSVHRRIIAERSAIAEEYRALGRQEAAEIKAKADREKSDILAAAFKEAEISRGEGEAKAAEIYGKTYAQAPDFFRFLRGLEADRKILNKQATFVLSSDSELMGALTAGEEKR